MRVVVWWNDYNIRISFIWVKIPVFLPTTFVALGNYLLEPHFLIGCKDYFIYVSEPCEEHYYSHFTDEDTSKSKVSVTWPKQ